MNIFVRQLPLVALALLVTTSARADEPRVGPYTFGDLLLVRTAYPGSAASDRNSDRLLTDVKHVGRGTGNQLEFQPTFMTKPFTIATAEVHSPFGTALQITPKDKLTAVELAEQYRVHEESRTGKPSAALVEDYSSALNDTIDRYKGQLQSRFVLNVPLSRSTSPIPMSEVKGMVARPVAKPVERGEGTPVWQIQFNDLDRRPWNVEHVWVQDTFTGKRVSLPVPQSTEARKVDPQLLVALAVHTLASQDGKTVAAMMANQTRVAKDPGKITGSKDLLVSLLRDSHEKDPEGMAAEILGERQPAKIPERVLLEMFGLDPNRFARVDEKAPEPASAYLKARTPAQLGQLSARVVADRAAEARLAAKGNGARRLTQGPKK